MIKTCLCEGKLGVFVLFSSFFFLNLDASHFISALISPPASYRACALFELGFFLLCDALSPLPPLLRFETAMFRNILFMCIGGLIHSLMRRRPIAAK